MIKRVGFFTKRSGLTDEEFRDRWLRVHTELIARLPGLRKYTANLVDREEYPNCPYNGFSELWFDSAEAVEAAYASEPGQAAIEDRDGFLGEFVSVVVEEHVIV